MTPTGTYAQHPTLAALPALVRLQRKLEAELQPLRSKETEERAVRAQIDELLLEAGLEHVTCAGYDISHVSRAGRASVNPDTLRALLVAAGVDAELLDEAILKATETGAGSQWATVRPMKGARVAAEKPAAVMAKASLRRKIA